MSYGAWIKTWQQPRPKPGEFIVDVQYFDGECISIPYKSAKSASKAALGMCEFVAFNAISVASVAIYFHPQGSLT